MKALRDLWNYSLYPVWEDYIKPIAVVFVILGIMLLIVVGMNYLNAPACNAQTADIGLPHRWLFWGGCQVFEGGKWIPLENWRYWGK